MPAVFYVHELTAGIHPMWDSVQPNVYLPLVPSDRLYHPLSTFILYKFENGRLYLESQIQLRVFLETEIQLLVFLELQIQPRVFLETQWMLNPMTQMSHMRMTRWNMTMKIRCLSPAFCACKCTSIECGQRGGGNGVTCFVAYRLDTSTDFAICTCIKGMK